MDGLHYHYIAQDVLDILDEDVIINGQPKLDHTYDVDFNEVIRVNPLDNGIPDDWVIFGF